MPTPFVVDVREHDLLPAVWLSIGSSRRLLIRDVVGNHLHVHAFGLQSRGTNVSG